MTSKIVRLQQTSIFKGVRVMVFNATFNTISVILWRSTLLVEETRVPRENHWNIASHKQTLSHNVVLSTPCHQRDSNSQFQWWLALIAQVVVNPTTIRSRPRQLALKKVLFNVKNQHQLQCFNIFFSHYQDF